MMKASVLEKVSSLGRSLIEKERLRFYLSWAALASPIPFLIVYITASSIWLSYPVIPLEFTALELLLVSETQFPILIY